MLVFDPICALATPPGAAGLAVIRLSGAGALAIADKCFRGKIPLSQAKTHTILYGVFEREQGHERVCIDQVTASVYRAPHSYTGEDVVEFGCHGGVIVSADIIEGLIAAGARHAEPGEFTKRAFLNGKMDLTQVEAVSDLIHAVSRHGSRAAARQLMGGLTRQLEKLREDLIEICGLLELELDFSEEDIEFVDRSTLVNRLERARALCSDLAQSAYASEIIRSGYNVGIIGYPNAGKSSLLNALLGRKRAIVSDMPGTTRDYIDEVIHLQGVAVRFIDTAGFRSSSDMVEVEGIELALKLLEQCHLIIVLNDITQGEHHSVPLVEHVQRAFPTTESIVVHNKIDLLPLRPTSTNCAISAATGEGIQELKKLIASKASSAMEVATDAFINTRQAALLQSATESLAKACRTAVSTDTSNELIAIDLRGALRYIGEITGAVWNEDVLQTIFARFCIGK